MIRACFYALAFLYLYDAEKYGIASIPSHAFRCFGLDPASAARVDSELRNVVTERKQRRKILDNSMFTCSRTCSPCRIQPLLIRFNDLPLLIESDSDK